jgi:hypothetical protein
MPLTQKAAGHAEGIFSNEYLPNCRPPRRADEPDKMPELLIISEPAFLKCALEKSVHTASSIFCNRGGPSFEIS